MIESCFRTFFICHGQVNEFVWKCPTISGGKAKLLKFRTFSTHEVMGSSISHWYLKSINEIDIVKMDPRIVVHQVQFYVKIYKPIIFLSRLYPTYPEISGFEILQFIANLAFQCKFFINVIDGSDISLIYNALYGKSYYEYHLEAVDLSQNFLFKKIVVKKKTFLDCFETQIKYFIDILSVLFLKNIRVCENAFVSVELCVITFETHHIFYRRSFRSCIDWSRVGRFPRKIHPRSKFEITSEDLSRIMKKQKQPNMNFVELNRKLDKKNLKTFDEIKTQIFDTSFLIKSFSNIFELCFVELEKQKSDPNPEDIFKLYLRPCVLPNINLFFKYHTAI